MTRQWTATRARSALPGVAVSAVAGVVFLVQGFQGALGRDLAIFVYAGQTVADGSAPYVDMVNRSGPLSHLVPGIGIWLGRLVGIDDVVAARMVCWALSVLTVYVVYRTAHRMFGSVPLAAATGLTMVMITGFVEHAARGPRDKTIMLVFLALALDSIVRRQWLRTGLYISLATLTWQPAFFPAIVTALVVLALARRDRVRALVRLGIGGVTPLALFLVWYAAIGHLRDFLDGFVLIHLSYTRQSGFMRAPGKFWDGAVAMYGFSWWALLLGCVAVVVAGVLAVRTVVRDRDQRDGDAAWRIGLGIGTVVAALWVFRAYNAWPDLYSIYPFAALGIGLVLAAVVGAVGRVLERSGRGAAPAAWVIATAWCVAAVLVGGEYAVRHRVDRLEPQREQVLAVLEVLGPDASMQSVQAPGPLVLAGQRNPEKYQMFSLGLGEYVADTRPGALRGFTRDLLERRPDLLAVQDRFDTGWIQPALDEYVRIGRSPYGYDLWVPADLDPAVINQAELAFRG